MYKDIREYVPTGLDPSKHQIFRKEAWGIGIENELNSFDMTNGPYFTLKEALDIIGDNKARIIHFKKNGGDEITWYWRGNKWYKRQRTL